MLWASCEKANNFGRREKGGTCLSGRETPDVVALVVVVALPGIGVVPDLGSWGETEEVRDVFESINIWSECGWGRTRELLNEVLQFFFRDG